MLILRLTATRMLVQAALGRGDEDRQPSNQVRFSDSENDDNDEVQESPLVLPIELQPDDETGSSTAAKELCKQFAPAARTKSRQLDPPPSWRTSVPKVRSWCLLTKELQREEKKTRTRLTRVQKDERKVRVPGMKQKERDRAATQAAAPASCRTRSNQDNRR